MNRILLYIQGLFYMAAGCNHFRKPAGYEWLIPPYLPFHSGINIMAGMAEILLGFGLLLPATRKAAAGGIILLLILFIPAHIYFIQLGGCLNSGYCFPAWVGWVRLLVFQPLLIAWAWRYRK